MENSNTKSWSIDKSRTKHLVPYITSVDPTLKKNLKFHFYHFKFWTIIKKIHYWNKILEILKNLVNLVNLTNYAKNKGSNSLTIARTSSISNLFRFFFFILEPDRSQLSNDLGNYFHACQYHIFHLPSFTLLVSLELLTITSFPLCTVHYFTTRD